MMNSNHFSSLPVLENISKRMESILCPNYPAGDGQKHESLVQPGIHTGFGLKKRQAPEYMEVKKLNPGDIEKAAGIITEAFMDYPLPGQFIKDVDSRRSALQEMFKLELRKALKHGSVYTLDGDFQEVAIWKHEVVPESDLAYLKYSRLSTLKLLLNIKPGECIKLLGALRNIMNTKLNMNLPVNTAELYIVGVNPANQGQGRLSKLLKPVLKEMQKQARNVLVMTNTESNKKIYEHLGFQLQVVFDDKAHDCVSYYLVKPGTATLSREFRPAGTGYSA